MVRASLKNPYAVVAISLIVVILGMVSYQKMVRDIFPEINVPVVAVATFYKGMGPSEMEGAVTLRLEQLFLQASYVEHMESRSLPGISLIKIYFHPNYNVDAGLAEITSLAYSALRFMPKGMFPPTIIKFGARSEEHTSELQSLAYLVCRLLLEKKKNNSYLLYRNAILNATDRLFKALAVFSRRCIIMRKSD